MRKIGIIILLVLCLTLLLLAGCIVNTVIPETAIENLENQEYINQSSNNSQSSSTGPIEELVIEDTEESGTGYPQKWSGLGMLTLSTLDTSEFDDAVDDLLANGFTEIRVDIPSWEWEDPLLSKPAVIRAVAKGAKVIWGVTSYALTSSNWSAFRAAILYNAQWAQDNGVFEFQLGNELESFIDSSMTVAELIANLKSVATDVKAIFTRGNISYSCDNWYIPDWITAGKGDIDILASNVYMGYGERKTDLWKTQITNLVNAFGVDGTYLTEFNLNSEGLDYYSEDEEEQAAGVAEMLDYIKDSGMTRAIYFCYDDSNTSGGPPGFGVMKADGTYRKLWNQALLNSESVKFATVPTKTTTASLSNIIALIPK